MKKMTLLIIAIFVFSANFVFADVTGKIAGTVIDKDTGEPLPGANIVIDGTMFGAATNLKGQYVILRVPPGVYILKATMMGYTNYTIMDVRVNLDQTTTIDFQMSTEILTGQEVTIVAVRPPVEKDVAASKKNISSEQIQTLPATTVEEVMGLQAGITNNLGIRGGGREEALFMVDGVTLRDGRSNDPITAIPLSAVQEVSVQTGGFGAEYNNVRSGVVNLVTKEGDKKRYSGTISFKHSPPYKKHFGISPFDPDSYWLRPYLDPDVCWTGTSSGAWDTYTQRQYPGFEGWNVVSNRTLQDTDPTNDLTPEALQRIFQWQHRKQGDIKMPDYNVDAGFGGPVPFISKSLGGLRFYASYRREQNAYLYELSRKGLTEESGMLKLTSDINPAMKLSIMGIYGQITATTSSRSGGADYMDETWDIAYELDQAGFTVPWRLYTNLYWCPTATYFSTLSAKFTHVLSPNTYYEAVVKRVGKKYHTSPLPSRDRTADNEIFPGYFLNEAPIGFETEPVFAEGDYMGMGGAVSTSRDYSEAVTYNAKVDLISQINHNNQIKAGLELEYNDYDMRFGMVNLALPEGNTWTEFTRSPFKITAFVQDKIEYEGFISTLGLILDYSDPTGKWYNVGDYDRDFYSQNYDPDSEDLFLTKNAKEQLTLSPRLAISHPITENSKLYFNYGHYRQIVNSDRLYRVQRSIVDAVDYIGDPTLPFEKTVAYELGYDHAIFRNYLFHLAAYYRDISDQWYWVNYISYDGKVNYSKLTNASYADIRGFEFDFTKTAGNWFTGNLNYEYRVGTSGYFGSRYYYENPSEMRDYLANNPKQEKPLPRPRIKAYLDFHTPDRFGPDVMGQKPIGGWHVNLISQWISGAWFTWNPQTISGIEYNVRWKDYYNFDLKISKTFPLKNMDLKFYVDVFNVFNIKYFSGRKFDGGASETYCGFSDIYDYDYYMKSLHLPSSVTEELGYGNIPGDDKPGDYRKQGVKYQPMEWTANYLGYLNPKQGVIYYDATTKKYYERVEAYQNEELVMVWSQVDKKRLNKILDNKAYIDMPNQTFSTFLNPRDIFFGLTLSYHF